MKIFFFSLMIFGGLTCGAQSQTWHAQYDCYLAKKVDSLTGSSLKSFISDIARMQIRYEVYANTRFVYAKARVISTSPAQLNFTGTSSEEVLLDKQTSLLYRITDGKTYKVAKDSAVADSSHQTDVNLQKCFIDRKRNISLLTSSDLPSEVTPVVYIAGLKKGIKQLNTDDYVFILDTAAPADFDFQKVLKAAQLSCKPTNKSQSLF